MPEKYFKGGVLPDSDFALYAQRASGAAKYPDATLRQCADGPKYKRVEPHARERQFRFIRKTFRTLRARLRLRPAPLRANVAIPGQGTHNVLYVATEHDLVYAFDADTGGAPLWQVNFLVNGATTLSTSDVGGTQDINPELGITGTPVIDSTTGTLYVVVNTKESGALIYRLHALDITTGAEKFGGPVQLTGSVPGTAPDGNGATVPFNVQWANQRPGLLLLNGYIFIGFSSHGDNGPWHGWILGYNASTLKQTGIWCSSPNGRGNGIWGAGSGLSADANGNTYVATGNGDDTVTTPAPPPSTTIDYGDSIVRVNLANGVPIPTDYFTPYNQGSLDGADSDLGSGGVLVVPDQPVPIRTF